MIERLHPITLFIFFIFAMVIPAFSGNPLLFCLSLAAAIFMRFTYSGFKDNLKKLPGYLIFFVLISIINPLFYHDGNTVLFYQNGLRITLEALLYGMSSAVMLTGTLIWCSSLSHYMTDEKMLCLFGHISPKAAIILSMTIRFIPMYSKELTSYRRTQKMLGIYGSGSLIEKLKGEALIFGGFMSRILEHSMTTADSMTARGYGTGKLKIYSLFSFNTTDLLFLVLTVAVSVPISVLLGLGTAKTEFYPIVKMPEFTLKYFSLLAMYFVTAVLLPVCDCFFRARLAALTAKALK